MMLLMHKSHIQFDGNVHLSWVLKLKRYMVQTTCQLKSITCWAVAPAEQQCYPYSVLLLTSEFANTKATNYLKVM